MKKALIIIAVLATAALGFGGASALASKPVADPPPTTTNPGSPGDDCSHGNSDKPCKEDPSPNGKDCLDHGNARGNEDHCLTPTTPTETTPTETTPTETTPTETTPTTPTETTPTETTPTTPSDIVTIPEPPTTTPTPPVTVPPVVTPPVKKPTGSPTKIVKVDKTPGSAVVVITTADGKKHTAIAGQG